MIDKCLNKIYILNFSNVYEQQKLFSALNLNDIEKIEMRDISGTNCYCDQEAMEEIRKRISREMVQGIHFIDSGNYHYMSRIWTEMIDVPFQLLVFDHHTDMQLPAFGGLLSCGGWIADALDHQPLIDRVLLLGPSDEDYDQVEGMYKIKTTHFSEEQLNNSEKWNHAIDRKLPIYLSIDKDILSVEDVQTNWSQGNIRLEHLLEMLRWIRQFAEVNGVKIIGIDICGEYALEEESFSEKNNHANTEILSVFSNVSRGMYEK